MKPPYTSRQGQFLAFIHHYTTLQRAGPGAEHRFASSAPGTTAPFNGSYATTNIPPPARRDHTQQPTDTEAALLRLGKMQPEDWFAPQGFPKMCELLPAPRRFSLFPWPGESLKPPFQSRSNHHGDAH
jgi:hypothetical protein